ncbi:MAG: hypothetical protein U9R15_13170 [Chloroflexota bacterium]|nr:hypothetical protein [Chloroflexota bacterium]
MTITDLKLGKNILGFRFDNKGFIVEYSEDGVNRQYGSTSRSEMSEFAKILSVVIKPKEGIVE